MFKQIVEVGLLPVRHGYKFWPTVVVYSLIIIGLSATFCECIETETKNKAKPNIDKTSESVTEKENLSKGSDIFRLDSNEIGEKSGCVTDGMCLSSSDVASFEAIKALHAHLDDDQSGDIDLTESLDFLREELHYTKGLEKRQKDFHSNNDQHVSVNELWELWLANEVHNWTVEQTVGWLYVCVELGQYADIFYENAINGSVLPRLAANNEQFLTRILGIKNPTHRSKISIKAMDIILFGPPKEAGSLVKDIFLASLIIVILILMYKFNKRCRSADKIIKQMDQEMEEMQEELLRYHEEKKAQEGAEMKSSPIKGEEEEEEGGPKTGEEDVPPTSETPPDTGTEFDSQELDLQSKDKLQMLLQLTYERERMMLHKKMQTIRLQFEEGKELCNKLKQNRNNFFGALSFIHGKMETKLHTVNEMKTQFMDYQEMDGEMKRRWGCIEQVLDLTITENRGVKTLQFYLKPFLQTPLIHSANSTVGLATAGLERGRETSTSMMSRQSFPEDLRRRRVSHLHGGSMVNEVNQESNLVSSRFSLSATVSQRSVAVPPNLVHSHTVGSGLSNYDMEDYRSRSSSNESKAKKIPSSKHLGTDGNKNGANGYSTDDTESSNYTIGENDIIRVDSNSATSQGQNTPPHSPSTVSLREGTNKEEPQRTSSDKNIGRYSSEPSLEIDQSGLLPSEQDTSLKPPQKKRNLGRPKFFKFKAKSDKTNK